MPRTRAQVVLTHVIALTVAWTATGPTTLAATGTSTATDAAAKVVVRDKKGDAPQPGIDIRTTTMTYRSDGRLSVSIALYKFGDKQINAAEFWLDTKPKKKGPDYKVMAYRKGDGEGVGGNYLYQVQGFDGQDTYRECESLKVGFSKKHKAITASLKPSCLGKPDTVRNHLTVWNFTEYQAGSPVRGYVDKAPGGKRFSGTLHAP